MLVRHQYRAHFIHEDEVERLLQRATGATPATMRKVIEKARLAQGLTIDEVALLLGTMDAATEQVLYSAAHEVKLEIYGRRVVLFAPLYVSNHCVNNCRYCGYRQDHHFPRRRLTMEELEEEVKALERMGHKRLALEAGEDPALCPVDFIVDCIRTIHAVKLDQGSIRRVNVNIAAATEDEYAQLKEAGIGTYILFQETYHRPSYRHWHPRGPKSDYDWHTTAHHRAMRTGLDDVGLGVLFGLYDWRFEVLALLQHARSLEEEFGVGPHTISVPRLRPAAGVDLSTFPHLVPDRDFRRLVAILRLAVPYTGMILSTRESPPMRDWLMDHGISQLSAGSCTGVGGYQREGSQDPGDAGQFEVEDRRSPDQMLIAICESGYLPSYCTACYRKGRTGDRFMSLAKTGAIQELCEPNALLTFKEYLLDYASPKLRRVGEKLIEERTRAIANPRLNQMLLEALRLVEAGKRDLYL
ncbi:MAG: [FeFe] hydrogenase H-cluster radical SAM maturase HydG [Bacillota bacterium]